MAADFDFVKRMTPPGYRFPSHRLQRTCEAGRTPLVLVACGSFSPITFLHLLMFPMARAHGRNEGFEVIGGYMSPVSDAYKKKGLVPAHHRLRMCELAAENMSKLLMCELATENMPEWLMCELATGATSEWLMVDPWEAKHTTYIPTARVLDHFEYEINHVMGGVECSDGTRKRVKIVLLAGADLIQTISIPEVWDARDVDHILGDYGVFVLERKGTELGSALKSLKQWEKNIHVIRQVVPNDMSSTKVRSLLKRRRSIDCFVPDDVKNYIQKHPTMYGLDTDKNKDKLEEAPEPSNV